MSLSERHNRVPFDLGVGFRVMDAVAPRVDAQGRPKRRQQRLTYKSGSDTRSSILLAIYTSDPEGYEGPPVMECRRPGASDESELEPFHLYVNVNSDGRTKVAHIPRGLEGDEYITDGILVLFENLEAQGEDPMGKPFFYFVDELKKHFDIIGIETRVEPIWKVVTNKFLNLKIDSKTSDLYDLLDDKDRANRENFSDINNRLTHVENRVDDLADDSDNRFAQVNGRVDEMAQAFLQMHISNGGTMENFPYASLLPQGGRQPTLSSQDGPSQPSRRKPILNDDDRYAFDEYTSSEGCIEINPPIRQFASGEITLLPEKTEKLKLYLEAALAKLPNFTGTVYRGVEMPKEWIKNLKKAFKDNPKSRVPFSDPAFLSTSTKWDASFSWMNCRMIIRSKTGKYIAPYSNHPGEYEVLFTSGTKFIIRDILVLDTGKLLVRMEEV